MATLQIIGGGKMGEALLGGLIEQQWASPTELVVIEPDPARQDLIASSYPGVLVVGSPQANVDAIVAVKPAVVPAALGALANAGAARVLSIAAGVTIATLEASAGEGVVVVRAMPNTPALVGLGASAIAGGEHAGGADMVWARSILESVGLVVRVDEADLDAVTGLSGSGPAYLFLLAEALISAGQAEGLDEATATLLVEQTLLGAATLLSSSEDAAAMLRENVTSPGGTTAAGLAVFASHGFVELVADVVSAATARSRELGAG